MVYKYNKTTKRIIRSTPVDTYLYPLYPRRKIYFGYIIFSPIPKFHPLVIVIFLWQLGWLGQGGRNWLLLYLYQIIYPVNDEKGTKSIN